MKTIYIYIYILILRIYYWNVTNVSDMVIVTYKQAFQEFPKRIIFIIGDVLQHKCSFQTGNQSLFWNGSTYRQRFKQLRLEEFSCNHYVVTLSIQLWNAYYSIDEVTGHWKQGFEPDLLGDPGHARWLALVTIRTWISNIVILAIHNYSFIF